MQIYRLRQQEKELFDWLDPFGFLDRLVIPNYFSLAACVKGEDGGDVPAGILVGSISSSRITIEWMCVAPELRGQGIGDGLLDKVFEIANSKGFEEVAVRFLNDSDIGKVEENAVDYFTNQMFWEDEYHPGEWDIFSSSISEYPYFQEGGKNPEVVSLDEIDYNHVLKAIDTLGTKEDAMSLYDITKCNAKYDKKLSAGIFREDKLCGLLLCLSTEYTCYPVFLYAENEKDCKAMLRKASKNAERLLPEDGNIRIIAADDAAGDLAETIFPNEMIRSEILVAEADM